MSSILRKSLGPPVRREHDIEDTRPPAARRKSNMAILSVPSLPPSGVSRGGPGAQPHRLSKSSAGASGRVSGVNAKLKRPPLGSRASSVGGNRQSIFGQMSSQVKKDPRPLGEKSYQATLIRNLVAFLADNGYPHPITNRSLQLPSTKVFLYILNFMLEMIDKSLPVNGLKLDEEVPKTFKLLGYPFTISRNHMLNVGSPSSWPILLGALSWLMNVCKMPDLSTRIIFPSESGFLDDEPSSAEMEFAVEKCIYSLFMQYGAESEEYQSAIAANQDSQRKIYMEICEDTKAMETRLAQCEEECQKLSESSVAVLAEKLEEKERVHTDLISYLNTDLIPSMQSLEVDIAKLDSDIRDAEVCIESAKAKRKQLEEMVRSQPMSAKEAQSLNKQIEELEDLCTRYRQTHQDNLSKISGLQMQYNGNVLAIEKHCRTANDCLRKLAAVLPDAASLNFLDFTSCNRSDPDALQKLLDEIKILRRGMKKLSEVLGTDISQIEGQIISAEATFSALHNENMKKKLDIDNLQHAVDMKKDSLERQKKEREEAMKAQQAEKHALEEELLALQRCVETDSLVGKELAEAKAQLDSGTKKMMKDLSKRRSSLKQLLVDITTSFEQDHENVEVTKRSFNSLLETFKGVSQNMPRINTKYLETPLPE